MFFQLTCCTSLAVFLHGLHYKYPSLSNFNSSDRIVNLDVGEGVPPYLNLFSQVWKANSMIVKEVSKGLFKYVWFLNLECETFRYQEFG